MDSLQKFGEIAIVRDPVKIWSKLKNQRFPAIYLGSAKLHAKNVHTFWNPVTQCSLTSRNVVLFNRNYADYYKLTPENVAHLIAAVKNNSYDEDDLDLHDFNHPNYMPPHVQARLLGPCVPREIRNLQTFYNPNPGTPEKNDDNELIEADVYAKNVPKREKIVRFQDETALLETIFDSNPEPKSFHETKQTQDSTNL
jgi:hypothetical protein